MLVVKMRCGRPLGMSGHLNARPLLWRGPCSSLVVLISLAAMLGARVAVASGCPQASRRIPLIVASGEDLKIRVAGTAEIAHGVPFAIIEKHLSGKQTVVRLGERIPNVGIIVKISRDQIEVARSGLRISLRVSAASGAPSVGVPKPSPSLPPARVAFGTLDNSAKRVTTDGSDQGVTVLGPCRFSIRRQTLLDNLANPSSFFTQLTAAPSFNNGGVNGFAITDIQAGTFVWYSGLVPGDIVTGINDQPLNNPSATMGLLADLPYQNSIVLEILRGGHPLRVEYDIQ